MSIEGLITTRQDALRLFVTIIALACLCMGLADYVAYFRLDDVAGRAAFVSPYFASVVVFSGAALYVARTYIRFARWWALAVFVAIAVARMAPLWSEAWISDRMVSINSVTLLMLLGATAALMLRPGLVRGGACAMTKTAFAVALLGVSISTLISYALIENNITTRQKFAKASSLVEVGNIEHSMTRTAALIQRFSERLNVIGHMPTQAFVEHEFNSYLKGFSYFQGFAIIDANRVVVWQAHKAGLAPAWPQALASYPGLYDWLQEISPDGQTQLAPIKLDALVDASKIMVAPLTNPEMQGWFVVAAVDMERLLADAAVPGQNYDELGEDVLPEFVLLAGVILTFFLLTSQRLADVARQRSEQLSYSALHDSLTGLPNRLMLKQLLKDACERAQSQNLPVAVAFFDLDGIKLVNDSMGHHVGDGLLVEVAYRLQGIVQSQGSVTRIGGDEFVLLFVGLELAQVQEYTQQIISKLSYPYLITGRIVRVTASAGVSISDGSIEDPMHLVSQADLAMLRAKQEGRNTWRTYTADMGELINESLELRNELQVALEVGGLELHYQPIVDGHSGQVVGLEALMRWPHSIHGYISPARVIPLAEETGQIVPLTDWVLNRACRDGSTLIKQGLPLLPVIVNISPLYFQRINFVQSVQQALHKAELPAKYLQIEITEGVLLEGLDATITKLTQLRELGIKASIDDFGTGYSSLSYLKNLPIDKIKIDRSFIVDVVTDPADAAIAQGMISMAHHLGLKVVAEGIENQAQLAFLKNSHCDEFQGYLFARPMSFRALITLLDKNNYRLNPPKLPDV